MTDSEKLDLLLNEMKDFKTQMADFKTETTVAMADLNRKMTIIQLDIENVVKPNIMRVAEGHLDLSRKLNETIKLTSNLKDSLESYDLYITHYENEITKLKLAK